MALLTVLQSLSPAERSAFLLHDVFDYSFAEVTRILRLSADATRQVTEALVAAAWRGTLR